MNINAVRLKRFRQLVDETEAGKINYLALTLINVTGYDTMHGSPNTLGSIENIVFIINGNNQIDLLAAHANSNTTGGIDYNTVSRSASVNITESATFEISRAQLQALANADKIACKINGSRRHAIYDHDDISPAFIQNIKTFYETHVKKAPIY